jgi:hypothetical protein
MPLFFQFFFSFLAAVAAVGFAFSKSTRSASVCFAALAIVFTLAGVVLQWVMGFAEAVDWTGDWLSLLRPHNLEPLFIPLLPSIAAVFVLFFGARDRKSDR